MPNATTIAGMATIIENVHLHRRPLREVKDEVAVSSIIGDDVGDEEEDVVGDSMFPKECQRMLVLSRRDQKGL